MDVSTPPTEYVLSRILDKLIHWDGSLGQELAEDLALPLSLLSELITVPVLWTASSEAIVGCETFLAYLDNKVHPADDMSATYALTMTLLMYLASRPEFLDCLLSAMSAQKPAILRHAGLKVVNSALGSLLLDDNEAVRERLRMHLLTALQAATFEHDRDGQMYVVRPFSPDQILYYEIFVMCKSFLR